MTPRPTTIIPLALIISLVAPSALLAGQPTLRWRAISPREWVVTLSIPRDGRAGAAIVTQRLPRGVEMVRCTPDPAAYRRKKGVVKWLIEAPSSTFQLHEELDAPISPSQLRFRLTYRTAQGGLVEQEYRRVKGGKGGR